MELVCEGLALKGKGVCKVADTGFVVMCDHALPGERFIGRVSRKKGNCAEVLAAIQESWMDPALGLSPFNVHPHKGFLKHLLLRSGRDCTTGLPELMVNFVTAAYKPELLIHLVNKIVDIPEVFASLEEGS